MKGTINLVAGVWGVSEYDADELFGEMDVDLIREATSNINGVASIGELWATCIEIAASKVGVDDTGALDIQFNYACSDVYLAKEFVDSIEAEEFDRMHKLFYALTGYEFEITDC